jgi:hypothetical protein
MDIPCVGTFRWRVRVYDSRGLESLLSAPGFTCVVEKWRRRGGGWAVVFVLVVLALVVLGLVVVVLVFAALVPVLLVLATRVLVVFVVFVLVALPFAAFMLAAAGWLPADSGGAPPPPTVPAFSGRKSTVEALAFHPLSAPIAARKRHHRRRRVTWDREHGAFERARPAAPLTSGLQTPRPAARRRRDRDREIRA